MSKAKRDIKRKLRVFKYAKEKGNISKACRHFGISRSLYYVWKEKYEKYGEAGLINKKPCPENPKLRVFPEIEEKVLHLRRIYHLGPDRIFLYIQRYHKGMKVSTSTVYRILRRHGLNHLPCNAKRQTVLTQRYEKQVPGHHIQVDVKFHSLKNKEGKKIRRLQYTAVDNATQIRASKVYNKHNQATAIKFIDYMVEKFPFRIHTIRTDNGHEFQEKFHWHVEDLGMRHVYIKPRTPGLNGKVERYHLTDDEEFYQPLSYTDDVDLNKKLKVWEDFYNYHRPNGSSKGKIPCEVLKEKLIDGQNVSWVV